MTRSDEAEWWFNAVYAAVQEIPYGRVTSYRHIATLLGKPERARSVDFRPYGKGTSLTRGSQVGVCLKHLPTASAVDRHHFYNGNVPWQRVINAKGVISPRGAEGAARQASSLRQEGVTITIGNLGELTVDLGTFGWFPNALPSEAAEASESEDQAGAGS